MPAGCSVRFLFCWQASHPFTYCFTSLVTPVMGIKRFDHKTKVKARSERRNLQTASQLCTKQVGTGEINQIIESLLKVEYPKSNQNIFNRNLRRKEMFLVSTRENFHCNRIPKARCYAVQTFRQNK